MSKSICFTLTLISIICCLSGQSQSKIQGKVHNVSGAPVAFANVLLLRAKDSVLVKGLMSTEEGNYAFSNIGVGTYIITSTYVGFKSSYTPAFAIKSENDIVNLDNIHLQKEEVELTAVTVTAKKPLFEQKIDRMVINVASSITYAGSTALDVLERSPGVTVDRQNNGISINGKMVLLS
jgi:hypothetical protein